MLVKIPNYTDDAKPAVVLSVAGDAKAPPVGKLQVGIAWSMLTILALLLPAAIANVVIAVINGFNVMLVVTIIVISVLLWMFVPVSNLVGNARAHREIRRLKTDGTLDLSAESDDRHLMRQIPRFASLGLKEELPESFSRLDEFIVRAVLLGDPLARRACEILAKNEILVEADSDDGEQLSPVGIADLQNQIQTAVDRACQELTLVLCGLDKEAFENTGLDPRRKNSEE